MSMPITLLKNGEKGAISHVGGKTETRQFLEKLGFIEGAGVSVISEVGGNLIVQVMDARVAISHEMASKIFV